MFQAFGLGVSVLVAAGALVINEATGFSLGVLLTLFACLWWLATKLQKLQDDINELRRQLDRIHDAQSKR